MSKRIIDTPIVKKVKQVEKQIKDQKQLDLEYMEEFVSSKENRANARKLAEQIQEHVSKNWFYLEKMVRKTGNDQTDCTNKLAILFKFGLCIGRRGAKGAEYKITFSIDEMIDSLDVRIKDAELSLKILKNKKRDLIKRKKIDKEAKTK